MEKDESYNLYHQKKQFIEKAEKEGFNFKQTYYDNIKIGNYNITVPNETAHIGEIVNNRFLIVFTRHCNERNKKYNEAISKLQKIAQDFDKR